MSDDLFLRIISREIPADIVYETEDVLAFRDINPQAPTHVLIIPKEHIRTINDIGTGHAELIGKLFLAAAELAAREGISEDGYRVVMNRNNAEGRLYTIYICTCLAVGKWGGRLDSCQTLASGIHIGRQL